MVIKSFGAKPRIRIIKCHGQSSLARHCNDPRGQTWVAVSCSELQCVAACCSALQYVAVSYSVLRVLQCSAVFCSVSQCVAVCCSALQSGMQS